MRNVRSRLVTFANAPQLQSSDPRLTVKTGLQKVWKRGTAFRVTWKSARPKSDLPEMQRSPRDCHLQQNPRQRSVHGSTARGDWNPADGYSYRARRWRFRGEPL